MSKPKWAPATNNTEYESLVAKEKREVLARCYEIILSPTWGKKPRETESNVSNERQHNS